MIKNREKGPDIKEEEKEIVGEAEETLEAQNILKATMEELGPEEERIKAEDEAYKEKEEREGGEKRRIEEEDRRNQILEHSMVEGAGVYMGFKMEEDRIKILAQGANVGAEEKSRMRDEARQYLEDRFNVDPVARMETTWNAEAISDGYRQATLDFGVYKEEVDLWGESGRSFSKEKYLDLMRKITRKTEEKWEQAKEDGMDQIKGVIPEELELSAVEKHLEGFAIAALEHDDIDAAVGALIEAGLITKKE